MQGAQRAARSINAATAAADRRIAALNDTPLCNVRCARTINGAAVARASDMTPTPTDGQPTDIIDHHHNHHIHDRDHDHISARTYNNMIRIDPHDDHMTISGKSSACTSHAVDEATDYIDLDAASPAEAVGSS